MNFPFISIVLPVYQNQETLKNLYQQLKDVCQNHQFSHEILFINDASTDSSLSVIQELAKNDPSVITYSFVKNVGQHRAVLKGIELSQASIIVIMDADLQDSPNMIPLLIAKLHEGYEAVFAGKQGKYESPFRLVTSKIFKYLLRRLCKIPQDAGMFMVMSNTMVKALEKVPMTFPFVVAMIGLTGLKTCSIPFSRNKRGQGKTTYTTFMRFSIAFKTLYQILYIKCKMYTHSK